MPLHLPEAVLSGVLEPADAIAVAEAAMGRIARGVVAEPLRIAAQLDGGRLNAAPAVDRELGFAGLSGVSDLGADGSVGAFLAFEADEPELIAVVDTARLRELACGATSALAARCLAKPGARTLGLIGCGRQAGGQIECLRTELPGIERVVVFCRDGERRTAFCARYGAEPADYGREAAEEDIVVTATTSRDPVLRGEWLREGSLVCAVGATRPEARELDNIVIERAAFVCCDSLEQAQLVAGDLVEPVARGVLDWLETYPLAAVLADEITGRQQPTDIVLYKSVGSAAVELALAALAIGRARERGLGVEL